MRPIRISRPLLLSACAWTALGAAAHAQTVSANSALAQVDDVIVTATP